MLLLKLLLSLSLVVGSFSRSDLRRSPSRSARKHSHRRQLNQTCIPRQAADGPDNAVPPGGGSPPPPDPQGDTQSPGAQSFKQDILYKGEDFLRCNSPPLYDWLDQLTSLFSQWDFFEAEDPTHGLVNYQKQSDAQSKHLAFVDGGAAVLAVDDSTTLQPGQKRDSYVYCRCKLYHIFTTIPFLQRPDN